MTNVSVIFGLVAIFVALLGLMVVVSTASASGAGVARSLETILRTGSRPMEERMVEPFADRVLVPVASRLVWLSVRLSPAGVTARINRRLDIAGNPGRWTSERVLVYKGLGLVGLGLLGLLFGSNLGVGLAIVVVVGFALLGFYLPDILIYNTGLKRQAIIQKTLPDALDMLTISVEAGLGFDASLSQVARNTEGPVGVEFFRVLQERQIGKTREASFRELAGRTTVPELKAFAASLVQADALGIPIANVLREQAKEMRIKRRQRAEEAAQKVPVKILFPLILFILPSLFVIVIGPGVIGIIKAFSSG